MRLIGLVTGKKENDAVVCHQHEGSKNRMHVSFSSGDCKCLQSKLAIMLETKETDDTPDER